MGFRLLAVAFVALVSTFLLVEPASAKTKPYWVTVRHKSVRGDYGVTLVSGTINSPNGIRIQVSTTNSGASVHWDEICSKGVSASNASRSFTFTASDASGSLSVGPHTIKHKKDLTLIFKHPDQCMVSADGQENGSGTLNLWLQKLVG